MSEEKGEYKILGYKVKTESWVPQGEIFLRYDEPEPEPEPEATLDAELYLNQLEGWIRAINIAIREVEPFIKQQRKEVIGKHGAKMVLPCLTKLYKVLTEMQTALYNLRKDIYR